jgi:hypothetical protein
MSGLGLRAQSIGAHMHSTGHISNGQGYHSLHKNPWLQ